MSAALERVWRAIDRHDLHRTLHDLIDIYSPSGKEEDIQLYLEERLLRAGCSVERQPVDGERFNLLSSLGEGESGLYFVGHVDTVAAWDLEDYGPEQRGGQIWGLGSADMKGGCAAMLAAWLALAELPAEEQPKVGLALVVGEEESGDGSAAFLERHRPEWVMIGEPTGLSACFSHYGYLETNLVTSGRRTHSSLPELGHNAVESMLRLLLHLGRDPLFDRTRSGLVYSIREMSSSRAGFVVPDRCETWIDLHLPPGLSPGTVEEKIRNRLDSAGDLVPDLDLELAFAFAADGYNLGLDNRPAQALDAVFSRLDLPLRFDTFRSHSDGNLFHQAGVRPIILGPGLLETAHTSDEQVDFRDVVAAARIYAGFGLELAASGLSRPQRRATQV